MQTETGNQNVNFKIFKLTFNLPLRILSLKLPVMN